ncbi:MAG: VOC family protein [Phycisphaerales bacterium]
MATLRAVYETILYARDLQAAGRFYAEVLGLRAIRENAELLDAFRLPDGGVLLLFNPDESRKPARAVPSHGPGDHPGPVGSGHVAFRMESGAYGAWLETLQRHGVGIEQEVTWDSGARSIYVRDPAGNSVELVEGEIWPS